MYLPDLRRADGALEIEFKLKSSSDFISYGGPIPFFKSRSNGENKGDNGVSLHSGSLWILYTLGSSPPSGGSIHPDYSCSELTTVHIHYHITVIDSKLDKIMIFKYLLGSLERCYRKMQCSHVNLNKYTLVCYLRHGNHNVDI